MGNKLGQSRKEKEKLISRDNDSSNVIFEAKQEIENMFNPVVKPVMSQIFKPPGYELNTNWVYKYGERKVTYRSEQYEPSESELSMIKKLIKSPSSVEDTSVTEPKNITKRKIIIDTDIGTDVDDVLAILMTLHLPPEDVELLAITTNYFPTRLRKKIADNILETFQEYQKTEGNTEALEVDIVSGTDYLCGTHRRVLACGNEGKGLLPELSKEEMKNYRKKVEDEDTEAVDTILKYVNLYPGEVTIISIGIPTNLGRVVQKEPKFKDLVDRIFVMGGGSVVTTNDWFKVVTKPFDDFFESEEEAFANLTQEDKTKRKPLILFPNHNISGDTMATKVLFESGCKLFIVSHSMTSEFWLEGLSIETLLEATKTKNLEKYPKHVVLCGRLVKEWFKRRWNQRGQCPHDPLAVYEGIYHGNESTENQSVLEYVRGTFVCNEWAAYLTFVPSENGPHYYAVRAKDTNKWLKWLNDTLIAPVKAKYRTTKSDVKVQ